MKTTQAHALPAQPASKTTAPAQPDAAAVGNAALFGLLDNGDFKVNIAGGVTLPATLLQSGEKKKGVFTVSPGRFADVVPGLKINEIKFKPPRSTKSTSGARLTLKSSVAIPHVEARSFSVTVNHKGKPSFALKGLKTTLGAFRSPRISLKLDEAGQLSGAIKIKKTNLIPRNFGKAMKAEGGGEIRLTNGKLSGEVEATKLDYGELAEGTAKMRFGEDGTLSGGGSFTLKAGFLKGVEGAFSIDNASEGGAPAGRFAGTLSAEASTFKHGIQGLQLTAGKVTVTYADGKPSGGIEGLEMTYAGLGKASVTASIDKNARFKGKGDFDVTVPGIADVKGNWAFRRGKIAGKVTIGKDKFPEGLPVTKGALTAKMDETGKVSFSGKVGVTLGPAGAAELRGSYTEDGRVNLGMTADLTITGLQQARFQVDYIDGDFQGEAEIATDANLLHGLSGKARVTYAKGLWAGTSTIDYEADNGKLKGTVTVNVAQTPEGALQMSGDGKVTAKLMPTLQGSLTAKVYPDGTIDVSGEIVVTDPVPLFDEKKVDKELFKYSQNIPLWAILVAVIRVRAGIRAGIGPGVFRDIKVTGSYTIGNEGEPSFAISGELFIPAYVEAYVAFGAGLGLDVVLGSLTGGIEGVASAGIYGAISVVPELSYEAGDYKIEGVATMAAGARLKIGLNAWAEVEALWVTVWENDWKLAEWMWNVGPDLALQAKMAYTFGKPEAPTLDFKTSNIDAKSMIQDAMPKDGPKPSGAKEALKNKAEWKGALKKPKPPAPIPPEVSQKATKKAVAPAPAKKKPPKKAGPDKSAVKKADAQGAAGKGGKSGAAAGAPGDKPDATVQKKDAPPSTGPRYPKPITLKTLDEPPAPKPRTMEDKKADLKAAGDAVRAVSKSVSDSDALDDRFPAIRQRFGLSSIGYAGDLKKGFDVAIAINPGTAIDVSEALTGTPDLLGRGSAGLQTKIWFKEGQIQTPGGSQPAGVKMETEPLGPDHPEGSPAAGNTLSKAFEKLPTKGKGDDARQSYIRGHLLGFRLGGPGNRDDNLFPITDHANSLHAAKMEAHIREWVNEKRHWVQYSVEIEAKKKELEQIGSTGRYKIDSVIKTKAAVLDTNLKPVSGKTREVTIPSTYRTEATRDLHDETNMAQVAPGGIDKTTALGKARPEDKKLKILGDPPPKANAVYKMGSLYGAISSALARHKTKAQISQAVTLTAGIGATTAERITRFYSLARSDGGADRDIGPHLTEGEKRSFSLMKANAAAIADAIDRIS
ncbi:DNA/RNA non-specific endonuclease [Fluviibacterium sp. DFM31]|uniref:DNA/RNA non-specific endonuclease n=1 Tax=Meridianimarinicoccus marinus TaxID=3231483 RepID=A0ABV3L7A2_9RHOB